MDYQGVKFKTVFTGHQPVVEDGRLKKLIYWCNQFNKYRLTPEVAGGFAGNLSFRLKTGTDQFIITKAGLNSGADLSADAFTKVTAVDLNQKMVTAAGLFEPSSESLMHFAVYQKRPEINAIFHGHDDKILASAGRLKLQQTNREMPYGTLELIEEVITVLAGHNFIVLKNHGFISLGNSLDQAGTLALKICKQSQ